MTEREIFQGALEYSDPHQRQVYLDRSCGNDAALRARIEALLGSHESTSRFLEVPAAEQLKSPVYRPPQTVELDPANASADETSEVEPPDETDLSFLSPSAKPGALGILGHYEILQLLGQGAFGLVFKAFDEKLQRLVAIKVMNPQLAATSPPRKRFLREARSAAAIKNENIVQVYSVEEQPLPYLVMEYVEGRTLKEKLDGTGPLEPMELLHLGRQMANGLAAAHARGLIHRDIKPGNILIEAGPEQTVKITDFGLARAADDATMTRTGVISGTPMYMAPEQAQGQALDHRADLFSLGSVLYQMACGRPPFRGPTTVAVLKRVADEEPRPIQEILAEAPNWLCAIIAKLHAKKPEDRFQSAREVAELLTHCQACLQQHRPIELPASVTAFLPKPPSVKKPQPAATNATPITPAPERKGRRRLAAVAAVFLALFAGLGLTEASGVTKLRGTIIRLFSPQGTLVVEVDDPSVSVSIDGEEMVITGAGAKEIRLKPGQYKVLASKNGKVVRQELVTVTKNGRQVVRVSREVEPARVSTVNPAQPAAPVDDAWLQSVAALSTAKQVEAVAKKLRELNPDFDGQLKHLVEGGMVTQIEMSANGITDISPLRAFRGLKRLDCRGRNQKGVMLADLAPLSDLKLVKLNCENTSVADLTPLKNMKLEELNCHSTRIVDLSPLKGMPLTKLACGATRVTNLSPLKGMPLQEFDCGYSGLVDLTPLKGMELTVMSLFRTRVSDLSPLAGMKLKKLEIDGSPVSDLSPLKGMPLRELACDFKPTRDTEILRSIKTLERINRKPAAEFWKEVSRKKSTANAGP